jgi:hypothetical protein
MIRGGSEILAFGVGGAPTPRASNNQFRKTELCARVFSRHRKLAPDGGGEDGAKESKPSAERASSPNRPQRIFFV